MIDLHLFLTYEPTAGIFRWKNDMNWLHAKAGDIAGSITAKRGKLSGYRYITIDGKKIKASKAAMIMSGISIQDGMVVDHINGITTDDRIENLRVVSRSDNQRNNPRTRSGMHRNIYTKKNGYMVQKRMFFGMACFGTYKTIEEAKEVLSFADREDCIYWISRCIPISA